MQIISNEDMRGLYDRKTRNVIVYDGTKAPTVEHSRAIFP